MKTAGKVNAVAAEKRSMAAAAAAGSQSYYDAQKSSLAVWFLPLRRRRPITAMPRVHLQIQDMTKHRA